MQKKIYINIDSSKRNIIPKFIIDNHIKINNDKLYLEAGSNMMKILCNNYYLNDDDKIMLSGVTIIKKNLLLNSNNSETNIIIFTVDSEYVTIIYNNSFDLSESEILKYDSSDLYIKIENIKSTNGSTIGNIHANIINNIHRIYLFHPITKDYNNNKIYIKLNKKFKGEYSYNNNIITFTFYHIFGIPINNINAQYPISNNNLYGYHIVQNASDKGFYIKLPKISLKSAYFGENICISKIKSIDNNYTNPNNYIVKLNKTYDNIIKSKIISSIFPNSYKLINDDCYKIYWENLDENGYIYDISLNKGNYQPNELINEIEDKIYDIIKVSDFVTNKITKYTNNNYMKLTIDTKTNIVTFKSYKEAILSKPIMDVIPYISESTYISESSYTLIIYHVNHDVEVGYNIIISGSTAHIGIPSSSINGTHEVKEIIDSNKYKIKISNFNLQSNRLATQGGNTVYIYVPNMFRLRFDYENTIGNILGFRNVGKNTSITEYKYEINNYDSYINELPMDETGNIKIITNNSINFFGDTYIYIVCKQLGNIINIYNTNDNNIFGIILLSGPLNCMLYNAHVKIKNEYLSMINKINELDFSFYDKNGKLFDFNGINHFFTIELTIKYN
jgi:hypothetical protein